MDNECHFVITQHLSPKTAAEHRGVSPKLHATLMNSKWRAIPDPGRTQLGDGPSQSRHFGRLWDFFKIARVEEVFC